MHFLEDVLLGEDVTQRMMIDSIGIAKDVDRRIWRDWVPGASKNQPLNAHNGDS
jgi:hypothetical protein